MKRIAFIPLDNRPVCYDLPVDIVSCMNDYELIIPPIEHIGGLYSVSDYDELMNWLNSLDNIDYAVISLDTIAYGSLVASRRIEYTYEQVKNRLTKLKNILIKKKIVTFAFSSIMRISNNNVNEEEKEYWNKYGKNIFDYSYNFHKFESLNEAEAYNKYSCISNIIPKDVLDDYLSTRQRNYKINLLYIDWLKQGIIDTLVFSKDDCSQYGLNVQEAVNLEKLLKENNLNGVVKTGADEIPLSLLSRIFTKDKNISICPHFVNNKTKNLISKYEDISVEKSVYSQIELAGVTVTKSEELADLILYVNNFEDTQGEHVMDVYTNQFNSEIYDFRKPCFYADIRYANGADNSFVNALLKKNLDNSDFFGYTAWNTTANTLGCAICVAMAKFCSSDFDIAKFRKLQIIRFLDDWAYQANIRKEIRQKNDNLCNDIIYTKMRDYEEIIKRIFNMQNINISYSFPWDRFFEIRIKITPQT